MGCWNETCGLSQNSILASEDVYSVIILNNNNIEKSCYGTGIATPMSLVIKGKYNDYGRIEDVVDDFSAQAAIELFNKYIEEDTLIISDEFFEDVKGQYKDYALVDNKFTSVEGLYFAIERGYLTLKNNTYVDGIKEQSIYFVLISKDVYESMCDTINFSNGYNHKQSNIGILKDDVNEYFKLIEKLNTAQKEEEITEMLSDADITPELKREIYDGLMLSIKNNVAWGGDTLKSKHSKYSNRLRVFSSFDNVHIESFRILDDIVKDLYTDDLKNDIKDCLAEMLLLMDVMDAFRKSWAPQGHTSQENSFDLVIEYTERQLRKMYKKRQEMVDDGWYEEGLPETIGAVSIFDEGKIVERENETIS